MNTSVAPGKQLHSVSGLGQRRHAGGRARQWDGGHARAAEPRVGLTVRSRRRTSSSTCCGVARMVTCCSSTRRPSDSAVPAMKPLGTRPSPITGGPTGNTSRPGADSDSAAATPGDPASATHVRTAADSTHPR